MRRALRHIGRQIDTCFAEIAESAIGLEPEPSMLEIYGLSDLLPQPTAPGHGRKRCTETGRFIPLDPSQAVRLG